MSAQTTVCHALCGFLLTAWAWAGGGSGTADDPYLITNLDELQAVQDDLSAHYALTHDIDASDTASWNGGSGFVPIGASQASPFTGRFDGRGHTISNLHIDRINSGNQGLFGQAHGASLHDVHLRDANVSGNYTSGILVGKAVWGTLISASSATGILTLRPGSADAKSGGLAGALQRGAHVDQCYSGVEVFASDRRQVGSLVGYLRGVEPDLCCSSITNSYASGTVHGNGWKQGNLLGDADGSRVDRSYSSGLGKALIGFNFRNPIITNSYWDSDRGAASSRYGGVPKSTAQMMSEETFIGWDFETIWGIDPQASYPFLRAIEEFEMAGFEVGLVKLAFRGSGFDEFGFRIRFVLDDFSDGIEPSFEDVRVRLGSYQETLPAGSLSCRAGRCTYASSGAGIVLFTIGEDYAWLWASGVDLAGTTNPLYLSLEIGNDRGDASVRLEGNLRGSQTLD